MNIFEWNITQTNYHFFSKTTELILNLRKWMSIGLRQTVGPIVLRHMSHAWHLYTKRVSQRIPSFWIALPSLSCHPHILFVISYKEKSHYSQKSKQLFKTWCSSVGLVVITFLFFFQFNYHFFIALFINLCLVFPRQSLWVWSAWRRASIASQPSHSSNPPIPPICDLILRSLMSPWSCAIWFWNRPLVRTKPFRLVLRSFLSALKMLYITYGQLMIFMCNSLLVVLIRW